VTFALTIGPGEYLENVQRADLNAIEEANGYQQLIDSFGYTQHDLADVIGKGQRGHVVRLHHGRVKQVAQRATIAGLESGAPVVVWQDFAVVDTAAGHSVYSAPFI
jgi:hypothetical protein